MVTERVRFFPICAFSHEKTFLFSPSGPLRVSCLPHFLLPFIVSSPPTVPSEVTFPSLSVHSFVRPVAIFADPISSPSSWVSVSGAPTFLPPELLSTLAAAFPG